MPRLLPNFTSYKMIGKAWHKKVVYLMLSRCSLFRTKIVIPNPQFGGLCNKKNNIVYIVAAFLV